MALVETIPLWDYVIGEMQYFLERGGEGRERGRRGKRCPGEVLTVARDISVYQSRQPRHLGPISCLSRTHRCSVR